MADLVAKAVLKADASGLVLAADQSAAALQKVKASTEALGDANTKTAPAVSDNAAALEAQRQAAEAAARAAGAVGEHKKQEVIDLKAVAAGYDANVGKMQALVGAYGEYNNAIAASQELLKAKLITDKDHAANMEGATAKLALAKKAFAETGETAAKTEVDMAAVERMFASMGVQAGVAGGQIKILRDGIKAIPSLVAANPIVAGFVAAAAVVAIAYKATLDYQNSVNRLNVTLGAHNLTVMGTSGHYLELAGDVSEAAGVTEKAGRQIAGAFADVNLSPQMWTDVSALARDYAAVLGGEVPDAAAKLADMLRHPTDAAKQLNDQYGLFDATTLKLIDHLDQMGAKESAGKIIVDAFGARIKGAADQTTAWATVLKSVNNEFSSLWDNLGKAPTQNAPMSVASVPSQIPQWLRRLVPALGLLGMAGDVSRFDELKSPPKSGNGNSFDPQQAARNQESAYLADLGSKYDPFSGRIDANSAERVRILKGISQGAIDAAAGQKLLTGNTREYNQILKEQHEAMLALNDTARFWEQRIKSLIEAGPETIAQARQEAAGAQGQADAYLRGASALDAFNAKQDVLKTTLPLIIAMEHASGAMKEKLRQQIDALTEAENRRHAAMRLSATLQDIDQRVAGANDNTDPAMTAAAAELRLKRLNEAYQANLGTLAAWRERTLAAGMPTDNIDAYAAKLQLVFQHDLKNLYDEDLRNHTDWASGIERANIDLDRSLHDFAAQSESALKGWASANQQAFEDFAATGKFNIGSLVDYVEQQFARMAYMRWMAPSINAVGSAIFGGVDQVFGNIDSFLGAGVHHSGGIAGYASITRDVPASLFDNARRYHLGGSITANDNLRPGEVPIIAQEGERVQTAAQQRGDLLRDEALVAALQRPIVLQTAGGSARGGNVTVNISNPPGVTTTKTETTDANGNTNIDIVNELAAAVEQKMAANIRDGNSEVDDAIAARHGLNRWVA